MVASVLSFLLAPGLQSYGTNGDDVTIAHAGDGHYTDTRTRNTITVNLSGGGDYESIGEALTAAQTGDTVLVEPGVYYGSVVITSKVSLVGAGSDTTYLVSDSGNVIEIRARNVFVRGFNITANLSDSAGAGISAENTDSCSVENVTVTNKSVGIHLNRSSSTIIINNRMHGNGILMEGDLLSHYDTHTIDTSSLVNGKMVHYWKNVTGGRIPDDAGQVILTDCTGVAVEGQNTSDTNTGIAIIDCRNIEVKDCRCDRNDPYGIHVDSSDGTIMDNNSCSSNTLSGIKCDDENTVNSGVCSRNGDHGIECGNNNVLASNTCNSNGLNGIKCGNINVLGSNICNSNGLNGIECDDWNEIRHHTCESNQRSGIYLRFASNCVLENNTCTGNHESGIVLNTSSDNEILENEVSFNTGSGMEFQDSSGNNIHNNTVVINANGLLLTDSHSNEFRSNIIGPNSLSGMAFWDSNGNDIINNTLIENADHGISTGVNSDDNLAYDNNFLDNNEGGTQASDNGTANRWNAPTGGNYWSDWITPDDDGNGVVDLPYQLDGTAGAVDNMPLTDVPFDPVIRADAGEDVTVNQHREVIFNGSGSRSNAPIVNFTWTFLYGGHTVHLYGERPSFIFYDPGTYEITLTVMDGRGHNDTDTMTVKVSDTEPPMADAGPDAVINRGETFLLNGSGSSDNTGISNYTWSFDIGQNKMHLYGVSAAFRFDIPGTYNITLTVTDTGGYVHEDHLMLTVRDSDLPIARAGTDRFIEQYDAVRFDGRASFAVGAANHTWTFTYDGNDIILYGSTGRFIFVAPGEYEVTLNVTDGMGRWDTDSLLVTIADVTPPEAFAGTNITVRAGDTVELDGSASRDNVGIVNYTWLIERNGSGLNLYGPLVSHLFDLPGIYSVRLAVLDGGGNNDTDEIFINATDDGGTSGNGGGDGDGSDTDDRDSDGDGWNDTIEQECGTDPFDNSSYPEDLDGDGIPDKLDPDIDGDGVPNEKDAYPRDPKRWERESHVLTMIIFICIGLVLFVAGILLYSKLKPRDILVNEKRQMIVNYINEHPGEYYREIKRGLSMPGGTLRHHLKTLEGASMIRSRRNGKYLFYFPYSMGSMPMVLTPAQKELVKLIGDRPGCTAPELAERCGKTRRAVHHHLSEMSDLGIVRPEASGKGSCWHLSEEEWKGGELT